MISISQGEAATASFRPYFFARLRQVSNDGAFKTEPISPNIGLDKASRELAHLIAGRLVERGYGNREIDGVDVDSLLRTNPDLLKRFLALGDGPKINGQPHRVVVHLHNNSLRD